MQSKKITLLPALALILVTEPVQAQDTSEQSEPTHYAFDDELVGGDLVAPDGEILYTQRHRSGRSLIQVRTQFVYELLKSVEQL